MGMGGGMVAGGGLFGMIFWLVVLGVLVAVVVRLLAGGSAPDPSARPGDDPLEILRRRYARGEIDEEEFRRRRRELE